MLVLLASSVSRLESGVVGICCGLITLVGVKPWNTSTSPALPPEIYLTRFINGSFALNTRTC